LTPDPDRRYIMVDRDGKPLAVGDVVTVRTRVIVVHANYAEVLTIPDGGEGDLLVVRPGEVRLEVKEGETGAGTT
jgi:hypothetical protein